MKFLIVDDSPTTRKILKASLRALDYQYIIEAENGKDAFEKIQSEIFDVIITDWNMPVMNGLELTRKIRNSSVFKSIPIILCTTRSEKDDILQALQFEINGYIVKPFTPNSLNKMLEPIIKKLENQKEVRPIIFK